MMGVLYPSSSWADMLMTARRAIYSTIQGLFRELQEGESLPDFSIVLAELTSADYWPEYPKTTQRQREAVVLQCFFTLNEPAYKPVRQYYLRVFPQL